MNRINRLTSIDFLRGVVMLLMTIDHTRDMFSSVNIGEHLGLQLPAFYFFTRWITHFCAPTFVFLSGLSIALWMKKYPSTLRETQWHVIKRGAFIVLLDITLASFLWTIIEGQPIFTIYLAELWAIGWGMILLALLLKLSLRTILLIGLVIIGGHNFLEMHYAPNSILATLMYGEGEFVLIPGFCKVAAGYAILPWLGIACVGYATGSYITRMNDTATRQQTWLFLLLALASLCIFIVLRTFNIYGDMNAFVYHSGAFLQNVYSFLDVTKYPPSLQYTLITSLLCWLTLAFRHQLERQSQHPIVKIVKHFGQAALLYYLLHLTLICLYFLLFNQFQPKELLKTSNLFVIYGLALLISITAYPILVSFKKIRDKYKTTYPILGYV